MLNGVAPVLIFNFPKKVGNSVAKFFAGIPLVGADLGAALTGGLPIPLYLDEQLTGILVKSETKTLVIETEIKAKTDGTKPKSNQRAVDSNVSINMVAHRDSIVLATLIALNDQIFTKVISKEYNVSYLNGSTVIFNGLLNGFTSMASEDNDLLHITMNISKGNLEGTVAQPNYTVIVPSTGSVPITGVTP